MLSKSSIHFSVDGRGCVYSLLFDLRPNYGGGNEDNVTSFNRSMHALLHSVPPTLQQATTDPHLCWRLWTLMGRSGSVSCGITAPFFWVLVHTRFCLCPPRVCFPVLCSGGFVVGLMATSSFKKADAIPRSAAPRVPTPVAGHS